MISVKQLQNASALSQLLGIQQQPQTAAVQSTQSSSAQTPGVDTLSISTEALQALQGLGVDSTQRQPDTASLTYKPHHHHHHHHGSVQAQQGTTTQSAQVTQTSQTGGAQLQTAK